MTNNESVAENQTPPPSASPEAGAGAGAKIEIASDEDWKNRVKAEDAALDQQYRGESADEGNQSSSGSLEPAESPASASTAQAGREQSRAAREMPKPTLMDLIALLSTQAMVALGVIPNPATKKAETQIPTARYFIDMLSILEEKTAGQLTKEESDILVETLHSLRMTYVQRSKESV